MKLSNITRINLSIILLCITAVQVAALIGFVPDERLLSEERRSQQCRLLATQITDAVARQERRKADQALRLFSELNGDLVSVGVRQSRGDLWASVGDHERQWLNRAMDGGDGCYRVPIRERNREWGGIEFKFQPLYVGHNRFISNTSLRLTAVVALAVGLGCGFQLTRVLRYLDPRRSVPGRVTEALDNFAEGVVVLDAKNRIMLANQAFAKFVDQPAERLQGVSIWGFAWSKGQDRQEVRVDTASMSETAWPLGRTQWRLSDSKGANQATFSVNATLIRDDAGAVRGSMLAFADITPLERSRQTLQAALTELQQSKEEILEQNKTLRFLATHDPLTNCVNRRTFFEALEEHWHAAQLGDVSLSVLMVDIDFFKSINDNHGHAKGDEVLRAVGSLLSAACDGDELAARFGGEEFSILLPGVAIEQAVMRAEEIRRSIEDLTFGELKITASLGVSAFSLGASESNAMLEQADQCLYFAKRHGRNQVARFDLLPPDFSLDKTPVAREKPREVRSVANGPDNGATQVIQAEALAVTAAANLSTLEEVRDWMQAVAESRRSVEDNATETQEWEKAIEQLQQLTESARSLDSQIAQLAVED